MICAVADDEPHAKKARKSEPEPSRSEEQKASVVIADVKQEENAIFLKRVKDEPSDEEQDIELGATPYFWKKPRYRKPRILHQKQTRKIPPRSVFKRSAPIPRLPMTRPGTPPRTEEKPTDISFLPDPAAALTEEIGEEKQEVAVEVKEDMIVTSDFEEEEDMEFVDVVYREVTLTLPQVQNDPPATTPRIYGEKRKSCNRRCAVCNHIEQHENLKSVTIYTEKLMLVLGAVYREELSIWEARACLNRHSKAYICRLHFGEACDEIFLMLHVKTPDEIAVVRQDMIANLLMTVASIRGDCTPPMTTSELRQLMIVFSKKYYQPPPKKDIFKLEPVPEVDNDTDDHVIIPKSLRQPRKQVLEEDQHDGTVKLIEQENFKLPEMKTPAAGPDCENPKVCCFCSTRVSRGTMLRVPKSTDRLARWLDKLGPEFAERLKPDCDNFICRGHFSNSSFSTRGRLLKGMIPSIDPEKVEVTYKIQGSSFLKLNEARSGTLKTASIDLSHGVCQKTQYKDDFEEEEPELEEQDELPKGDTDFAPPPRPVGRPRKYPIGVTKCVRKSFIDEQKANRRKNARSSKQDP